MELSELCRLAGLEYTGKNDPEILGITHDSRDVKPGWMFVGINGFRENGNKFVPEALANGAVAVVGEESVSLSTQTAFLTVPNARIALSKLCSGFYGNPSRKLRIIGVTGTNGKTSVTHMIRSILEASFCKCGLIGTVGCESMGRHLEKRNPNTLANMTTPDPPDLYRMLSEMVDDGVEYVVMEVTSHALALGKLEPIRFDVGIFTNLTPEHLDFHGNMQEYANAKKKLFRKCAVSVINADSDYAKEMAEAAVGKVVTCTAKQAKADDSAEDVSVSAAGVRFLFKSYRHRLHLSCPIPGNFTVMNAAQAAAAALELGIPVNAVREGLRSMSGVKGRMEKVGLDFPTDYTVMIDYAHTPDALEQLLINARGMLQNGGRLVLVFGCGGDRDRSKRPVMGLLASSLADFVVLTSDNSRSEDPEAILSEIQSGMDQNAAVKRITDRKEAIFYAIEHARPKDLILLAGKGHEQYEIDREGRKCFSEIEAVREAARKFQKKDDNGMGIKGNEN